MLRRCWPRCTKSRFRNVATSIADRLATTGVEYFEKLFERDFELFNEQLGEQQSLASIDSTLVNLGAEVFAQDMPCDTKRAAKHSVGLIGTLPFSSRKCFDELSVQGKYFVARLNPKIRVTQIEEQSAPVSENPQPLTIKRYYTADLHCEI